jgi:hypothetical protein
MVLGAGVSMVALGCSGEPAPTDAALSTSFGRLQAQVFAPSCNFAACHAAENTSGSGLVLAGTGAFSALVNVQPRQANVRLDGLRLVVPGTPDSSLLWHKVNGFVSGHHAHDYGAAMPFVGQPLPAGQVEFIRQWIAGGASATTDDISPSLLAGTVTQLPYTPLAPLAAGFQVRMPAFGIPSSSEREVFVYAPVGNTQEAWVNRIQTNMRTGSHHFVVYTFAANTPAVVMPTAGRVRDLKDASGTINFATVASMAYHVFFVGTQSATSDFTFPPGVAIRLPAAAMLDVNSHHVNSATSQATAWDHPPIITFASPLTLSAGQGLTSEVTYRGDPSRVVRFGLTSDDEMDIIFGYWY